MHTIYSMHAHVNLFTTTDAFDEPDEVHVCRCACMQARSDMHADTQTCMYA